jgi:hypothetical protein
MTAEVEPDSSSKPALPIPDEPLELKTLLRAAVGEDPPAGRVVALAEVAAMLWRDWEEQLVPAGVDETTFDEIVAGATKEVWLWVMGDRPYDQLVASIAGRTIRRTSL